MTTRTDGRTDGLRRARARERGYVAYIVCIYMTRSSHDAADGRVAAVAPFLSRDRGSGGGRNARERRLLRPVSSTSTCVRESPPQGPTRALRRSPAAAVAVAAAATYRSRAHSVASLVYTGCRRRRRNHYTAGPSSSLVFDSSCVERARRPCLRWFRSVTHSLTRSLSLFFFSCVCVCVCVRARA